MSTKPLSIAIVDQNRARATILEEGLQDAGDVRVTVISDWSEMMRQLAVLDPDVVIIDLENPSRDTLEQMFQVSRSVARPVAMFVDESGASMIEAAIDAGISAYVVDGLKRERVRAIVDVAISRFNAFRRLAEELARTKLALEDRKVIDRAKGILMARRRVSEKEAYALMRRGAMNENRRIAEVAQSIVTAAALLPEDGA